MKNRKKYIPVVIIMLAGFLCACGRKEPADTLLSDAGEGRGELLLAEDKEDKNIREHWEKGYDLLIEEEERKEAEADCRAALELTAEIYREADKGEASNVVLSEEVTAQMKEKIKTLGKPVTGSGCIRIWRTGRKWSVFCWMLEGERLEPYCCTWFMEMGGSEGFNISMMEKICMYWQQI